METFDKLSQDIDIGIESELLKLEFDQEFNQEFKDCVAEPRRVSQRVPRQESLRMWLRVQVCLQESLRVWIRVWIPVWIPVCLHAERKRWTMVLEKQLSVDKRDREKMCGQVVHNSVALNNSNASADREVFSTYLKRKETSGNWRNVM